MILFAPQTSCWNFPAHNISPSLTVLVTYIGNFPVLSIHKV